MVGKYDDGDQKVADDIKTKILEAAATEFAEKGYEGARVDAIAAVADVNKATLYYHIGDKQKLYSAVISNCFTAVRGQIEKADETSKSASERLSAIIKIIATQVTNNRAMNAILMREMATGGANLPAEAFSVIGPIKQSIHNVIEDGIKSCEFKECDPNVIHFLIVGGINFYIATAPVQQKLKESGVVEGDYPILLLGEVLGEKIADILLGGISK